MKTKSLLFLLFAITLLIVSVSVTNANRLHHHRHHHLDDPISTNVANEVENSLPIISHPFQSLEGTGGETGSDADCDPDENPDCLSSSDAETLRVGKGVSIPVVFFLTFGASLLPWYLSRYGVEKAGEILGVLSCFAAGVIIGAGFSHMLPDANEAFDNYFALAGPVGLAHDDDVDYPFASLLAVAVLLILVGIDSYVIKRSLSGMMRHLEASSSQSQLVSSEGHSHGSGRHAPRHNHFIPHLPEKEVVPEVSADKAEKIELESPVSRATDSTKETPLFEDGVKEGTTTEVRINMAPSTAVAAGNTLDELHHKADVASAWVFFFALSIHSLFDGLSVGAEEDVSGFYALLIAVVVHKGLDGFALGVPVYYAKFSMLHNLIILVFCAGMTPLGVGIGMAATQGYNGAQGQLAKAIILSLSSGSFFFIGLMEMLPAGLADGKWVKVKILLTFLGWGMMAILAIWV